MDCSDENSYQIPADKLFFELKIYLASQVLQSSVSLEQYPDLKDGLVNIFSTEVSLIDLARRLERDLAIYEIQPNNFAVAFKSSLASERQKNAMRELEPITETPDAKRDCMHPRSPRNRVNWP